MVIQILIVA